MKFIINKLKNITKFAKWIFLIISLILSISILTIISEVKNEREYFYRNLSREYEVFFKEGYLPNGRG